MNGLTKMDTRRATNEGSRKDGHLKRRGHSRGGRGEGALAGVRHSKGATEKRLSKGDIERGMSNEGG